MLAPIYAIGDIHGQKAMLEDALARIERDGGRNARTVFLGDYVDRGPDSKGVIDILCRGRAQGRDWICLKGNHDRIFEWFVAPPLPRQDPHMIVGMHWFDDRIGGTETALSYGLPAPGRVRQKTFAEDFRAALPDDHLSFLQGLKLSHREAGLFFVHAGVRPGVPLDAQEEDDLLWIREAFLKETRDHGAFVVHGHTPVEAPDLRVNRLNLDTGAGYGHPLTAAVLDDDGIFALGRSGRVRL